MEFLIRPSNSLTLCQVEMHAPFERSNDPLKRLHQHGQCSYPPASEEPLFRQQAIIARERREERGGAQANKPPVLGVLSVFY